MTYCEKREWAARPEDSEGAPPLVSPTWMGSYHEQVCCNGIPNNQILIVDAAFLNLTSPTEYAQMFGVRVFGNNVGNALGSTGGGALLSSHQGIWIYIGSAAALVLAYRYLVFLMARLRGRSAET
jgi:hypothetical protein